MRDRGGRRAAGGGGRKGGQKKGGGRNSCIINLLGCSVIMNDEREKQHPSSRPDER